MGQNVPAPPPPPEYGRPAAGTRPGVVTAAGVLLIIAGALGLLGGLLILAGAGVAAGTGVGGLFAVLAIVILAVSALELYAGIRVLGLHENGRMIGMVVAAIGLILDIVQIGRAPGTAIVGILLNGFVLWALYSNEQAFHR